MSNEYKDWYNDLSDKQKAIYEVVARYPFLLPRDFKGNVNEEFDYEYLCLELPKGWRNLFFQMCEDIKPLLEREGILDDFYFLQVKEKYNEMLCYTNGKESLAVQEVLQKYRYLSTFICTHCGKPARYEATGYLESFCESCWEKYPNKKKNSLLFIDTYNVVSFNDGKTQERTVSVKDEWERYISNLE